MEKEYIWYVCYGSNLCFDRFMCYLTGKGNEKYNLAPNSNRAFIDQNKPIASKKINIPYELYFAHTSSLWEKKGVCFLDTSVKSNTIGRAYLITTEQFNHVWKFEGTGLYSLRVELEPIDGRRAVTFTSSTKLALNKPSSKYYQVIMDGLIEMGLTEKEAKEYLDRKINNL